MKTIWREIPGFEEYLVSNDGRVKRNGREVRISKTPSGMKRVRLFQNGVSTWKIMRTLVKEVFDVDLYEGMRITDSDWEIMNGVDLEPIISNPLFDKYPETAQPYNTIAASYKVNPPIIYFIKHGKGWTKIWRKHRGK